MKTWHAIRSFCVIFSSVILQAEFDKMGVVGKNSIIMQYSPVSGCFVWKKGIWETVFCGLIIFMQPEESMRTESLIALGALSLLWCVIATPSKARNTGMVNANTIFLKQHDIFRQP